MDAYWVAGGTLITPRGIVGGAVRIARGRITAIRPTPPRRARCVNVRGAYVAPGFIDLHVWGDPQTVSREAARHGTTAFLASLAPEPPDALGRRLAALRETHGFEGA